MAKSKTKSKSEKNSDPFMFPAIPVTVRAEGTVAEILGPVPFTMCVPVGCAFFDFQVVLTMLAPRLSTFPNSTVRFYVNGLWTGLIDRGLILQAGDEIVLAAEVLPRGALPS